MQRRLKAVGHHLQTVWCTCDDDSDSDPGEDEVNSLRAPTGGARQAGSRHSSTREDLYCKDSDFQADSGGLFTPSSKPGGGTMFDSDPLGKGENRNLDGSEESGINHVPSNDSQSSPSGSMII